MVTGLVRARDTLYVLNQNSLGGNMLRRASLLCALIAPTFHNWMITGRKVC